MTALALALGLACASSWAAETAQTLTLDQLQQKQGAAIDTRQSAFYNGWPQTLNGTSGHEPAALNLSASWLAAMSDDQISAWAKQHHPERIYQEFIDAHSMILDDPELVDGLYDLIRTARLRGRDGVRTTQPAQRRDRREASDRGVPAAHREHQHQHQQGFPQ